jgi:hypothetical protein
MSTCDRIPSLSKSRFMAGRQCHKRLYLECYDPAMAGPSGDFSQAAFDIGHRVGALGRDRFPGGRLIAQDFRDHAGAELATEAALGDGSLRAIYEGAFSFDYVRIRTDVLDKVSERKFDLFEVKSTLDPKPEHDGMLQYSCTFSRAARFLFDGPRLRLFGRGIRPRSAVHRRGCEGSCAGTYRRNRFRIESDARSAADRHSSRYCHRRPLHNAPWLPLLRSLL